MLWLASQLSNFKLSDLFLTQNWKIIRVYFLAFFDFRPFSSSFELPKWNYQNIWCEIFSNVFFPTPLTWVIVVQFQSVRPVSNVELKNNGGLFPCIFWFEPVFSEFQASEARLSKLSTWNIFKCFFPHPSNLAPSWPFPKCLTCK